MFSGVSDGAPENHNGHWQEEKWTIDLVPIKIGKKDKERQQEDDTWQEKTPKLGDDLVPVNPEVGKQLVLGERGKGCRVGSGHLARIMLSRLCHWEYVIEITSLR